MATKSKSKPLMAAWLLLTAFGLSGLFAAVSQGNSYMQENYFESDKFGYQIGQFVSMLHVYELNGMTSDEMKKEITVSDEEIDEHRHRYGSLEAQVSNITSQYEGRIQNATEAGNEAAETALIQERDEKIADITENFNSDEHVRAKIIVEKEKQVDQFFKDLEKYRPELNYLLTVFKYHLTDAATGEVHTNLPIREGDSASDYMNKEKMYYTVGYNDIQQNYFYTGNFEDFMPYNDVAESILNNQRKDFEGTIGLSKSGPATHQAINDYKTYQKQQILFISYLIASFVALIASYLLAKRKPFAIESELARWNPHYRRLPLDVRAGILMLTAIGFLIAMEITANELIYIGRDLVSSAFDFTIFLLFTTALLGAGLVQIKLLADYRNDWTKLHEDWKNSLVVKGAEATRDAFMIRSVAFQLILLLGFVYFFGGLTVAIIMAPHGIILVAGFFIALTALFLFILMVVKAGYFNKILTNTEELAAGKLGSDLPVRGRSIFAKLAADINTLRHRVKTSNKEQAKSERLKTELITNVSHDLRTPLTSIITYTELLKTPDLSPEDRASYIEILDRKSKRLKVLIDDLFEATKMASGNIELRKEKVDLVQLLQQALAEHNEALSESSLQLRVSQPEHTVFAYVDGQKLWRVFDNLIGNILKYSLENTRVYITVKSEPDKVVLTFKNVTKYELGDDLDELFERFKRGDQSRHTDGSGLGLAIAKSIIDLHGGTLDINVDGDLFKVTVTLDKIS